MKNYALDIHTLHLHARRARRRRHAAHALQRRQSAGHAFLVQRGDHAPEGRVTCARRVSCGDPRQDRDEDGRRAGVFSLPAQRQGQPVGPVRHDAQLRLLFWYI